MINVLEHSSSHYAERSAYRFLHNGDTLAAEVSFAKLERLAKSLAANIQQYCQPGERVVLLLPHKLDFTIGFLACMCAGVIAVPVQLPMSRKDKLTKIAAISENAQASLILSTSEIQQKLKEKILQIPALASIRRLEIDHDFSEYYDSWVTPNINKESIAFLQYTSGSTGTPKGVMVSHGNLFHNEALIKKTFNIDSTSTIVCWLPFYHDMGLIGNMLQPLYSGASAIFMSPAAFLQKPIRWLQAINDFQATISGAPNFAYDLCCDRIRESQKSALDLSSWQTAFNGAERVRAETLKRFSQYFSCCGFKKNTFYPTYGLAEGTLLVTGERHTSDIAKITISKQALANHDIRFLNNTQSDDAAELVSCGFIPATVNVAIVDSHGQPCKANKVGEVWIASPSNAQGYWKQPQLTLESFANELNNKHYFKTGDLGFVYQNQLYITGRAKELIIINGCNYYPEDVERLVQQAVPGLRLGAGAAFTVDKNGKENLCLVQEVEIKAAKNINFNDCVKQIRQRLFDEYNIAINAIVLVKVGQVAKTSSGKIRRHYCRELLASQQLDYHHYWQSHNLFTMKSEELTCVVA